MSDLKIEIVVSGLGLGEGPFWDSEKQELYFVDVLEPSIQRYVPATGEIFKLPLATSPSFVIPLENSNNRYIIGYHRSLALIQWDGVSTSHEGLKVFAPLTDFKNTDASGRYNDAKCDSQGRLWVGTFGMSDTFNVILGKGALYSLDENGEMKEHMDKIQISNGLAWSKDSTKMYFNDTYGYVIYIFDFDLKNGTLSNKRVLLDVKKQGLDGGPDGMCIDTNDNLWVAFFPSGKILNVDGQTGEVLDTIDISTRVSNVTSMTFGGPEFDILYVTTGKYGAIPTQSVPSSGSEDYAGAVLKISNLRARGQGQAVKYRKLWACK